MTRFLLLAHGTRGDVDPFIVLGGVLKRRGYDVTVLTHAPYEAAVSAAGAEFRAVDDVSGYELHLRRTRELMRDRHHTHMADYYRDADLFLDRVSLAGGFAQIRREVQAMADVSDDIVVVGRLTSCLSGLMVAEMTGSPVCLISLSPFQSMTAPVTALHLARAAGDEINTIRGELGLPAVSRWSQWLQGADLTVGMWPRWFDEAGPVSPSQVVLAGFALGDRAAADARGVTASKSDQRENVILITGGTGRMLHPEFYPAAIAGLAAAGRCGIVVTPHADLVPSALPPGVVHRSAMPFAEVMPNVTGVVHHGGIGTIARALASGTPQLLLADGGDRPDNGARLERLGIARSLSPQDWSAEIIGHEIAQLGSAPRQEDARNSVGLLSGTDPVETLTDRLVSLADRARVPHAERQVAR